MRSSNDTVGGDSSAQKSSEMVREFRYQQLRKAKIQESASHTGHFATPETFHHNFIIPCLPSHLREQ